MRSFQVIQWINNLTHGGINTNCVLFDNFLNQFENIRNEGPGLFSSHFLKNNYHFDSLNNDFVANSIYYNLKSTFQD